MIYRIIHNEYVYYTCSGFFSHKNFHIAFTIYTIIYYAAETVVNNPIHPRVDERVSLREREREDGTSGRKNRTNVLSDANTRACIYYYVLRCYILLRDGSGIH